MVSSLPVGGINSPSGKVTRRKPVTERTNGPVLRFGIVGLGLAGAQALPALAARPYVKLSAAADVRPEALDKFERDYGGETYHSVEELAASPNVDVIHIATPHNLHVQHTPGGG